MGNEEMGGSDEESGGPGAGDEETGEGDDESGGPGAGDEETGGDDEEPSGPGGGNEEPGAGDAAMDLARTAGALGGRRNNPSHSDGDYFPHADVENVIGSPRGDTIDGNDDANKIWGGGGADTLRSHGGDDTIDGGADNDALWGGAGFDTLTGGEGDDTLIGGAGADLLSGGPGIDDIDGDAPGTQTQANVQSFENLGGGRVNVDDDADETATSYGGDTVTYAGSDQGVELTLGQLNPATWASTSSTGDGGHAWGDTVVNVENIIGSDHDDTLGGNNWRNVLTGGKGDDTLTGDDTSGGAQSDIFVFAPGDSTGPAGDVITDFNVSGITRDDDSDGAPNADIYGNAIHYQRDALDLRAFNFDLTRNADGSIATTLGQLESQGLKISNLMDADGDEGGTDGKDDREITLPDGGKITLLDVGGEALTIDNFIFDLF